MEKQLNIYTTEFQILKETLKAGFMSYKYEWEKESYTEFVMAESLEHAYLLATTYYLKKHGWDYGVALLEMKIKEPIKEVK